MMDRIKKIRMFFRAHRILRLMCFFFYAFCASQTKNDVGILREEILDKMQYENHNVEDLIKYYSKISPSDAQILNIKFLLLKGKYEEGLNNMFLLENSAKKDKGSELFFQYQCLYGQVCQMLGLTSEVDDVRNNLNHTKFIKTTAFTDLALDKTSFEIFTLTDRVAILRSAIKNYKRTNNVVGSIQSNLWLAETLGNDDPGSKVALDSALSLLKKSDPGVYYAMMIDNYLSKIYLKQNNALAAFDLLEKYTNSATDISNIDLKADFYRDLAISSAKVGDLGDLDHINKSYFTIVEDQNAKRAVARAMLVNHINKVNDEKLKAQKYLFRKIYITIFLTFICGLAVVYFLYRGKNRKSEESVVEADAKNFVIPDKTEKRILKKLEEFENKQKYIQKNVSLKMLAQQFDTNPNYLSEIVNNHKNSNFNTYINNLRVDYIVDKIRQDPEYRKYKVSYLADECGFSSHSLFTKIFKNRMDLSPTEFLQTFNE
ncbi:MAG: helix-turn-helix domain-containing protein [Chryseobacterium sp.]|nr:helix-turn-helix domain-containing protein [Chryseobacterium sp.]